MSPNKRYIEWNHPEQGFTLGYFHEEAMLMFNGMAIGDQAMDSLFQQAAIKMEELGFASALRVHFYAVVYADEYMIRLASAFFERLRKSTELQFIWFFDSSSEQTMGEEWAMEAGESFELIDTEPESDIRTTIRKFNEKAVNSGLYFRIISQNAENEIVIEASQHPFFHYTDFRFFFQGVRFCDIASDCQWTDDYSLQCVMIEWSEFLSWSENTGFFPDKGEFLVRWLISPIENNRGYILCNNMTVESRWL